MNKKKKIEICIVGLGFVGLTLAATLARSGLNVLGIEKNSQIFKKIKKGNPHFYEPGLAKLLKKLIFKKKLRIINKIDKKILLPNNIIITVGTPINKNKKMNIKNIKNTVSNISKFMQENTLIILRSTVGVGISRRIVLPLLIKSKKKFQLSFCPERTLEGKALKELKELPQIIGGLDDKSIKQSKKIFNKIAKNLIIVKNIETAEMIKLIDNVNRDIFFGYANEVAKACDIVGISATEVIKKGKLYYPRTNLPLPGLVGGPCLEKDPYIFSESFLKHKFQTRITMAARKMNEIQPIDSSNFILNKFKLKFKKSIKKILLIGLAFKGTPTTSDIRGTMAIPIINFFRKKNPKIIINGYDPFVKKEDFKILKIKKIQSINKANKNDLIIIMNNNKIFLDMGINKIAALLKKEGLVYDFWSLFKLSKSHISKQRYYISLGNHYLDKKI